MRKSFVRREHTISAAIVHPSLLFVPFSSITPVRLSPGGASLYPPVGCFYPFCGSFTASNGPFCYPLWVVLNGLHGWAVSLVDCLVSLPIFLVVILYFKWVYSGSLWLFFVSLTQPTIVRRWQVLEWLYLSPWQLVCGLIPARAKFL